jgi:ribosomal protein S18 acetylase RimI-like enzyme
MIIKAVKLMDFLGANSITRADVAERHFADSQYLDKIKKLFSRRQIHLLIKDKLILGYFFLTDKENIIHVYLYVKQAFSETDTIRLIKLLNESVEHKSYKYIIISHIFESVNILPQIYNLNNSNINSVSKMELSAPYVIEDEQFEMNYSISTDTDKNELITFHYTCYFADKEYMLGNWNNLIDYFFQKEVDRITLMCRNGNELIGACIGWIANNRKYLFSICVHPDYRGKGIGKYLLHRFLQYQPQISCYLTVYEDNIDAIALYEHFGFRKTVTSTIVCEKLMPAIIKE